MDVLGNSYASGSTENPYQYNGKEIFKDFGFNSYNYGARWYDPAVGRFSGVDPLADHPNQIDKSPYAYAWNNPILLNDPDGRCPECPIIFRVLDKHYTGGKVGQALEFIVGFTPAGPFLDVGEALIGEEVFTGNKLSNSERATALIPGKFEKIGDGANALRKTLGTVDDANDVKKIGPVGDAGAIITKQVPANWTIKPAKKGNGTRFIDPQNPKGNNVRVMQSNPNSPHPSQQVDYVKHTKNGASVDKNGKPTSNDTPEAHIPKEEFKFNK